MQKALFLFPCDLDRLTGLAVSTRERLEQRGRFPRRIYISPRRIAWRRADIEAWAADPEGWGKQHAAGGGA